MPFKKVSLTRNSKVRERILKTASRLFSSSGFAGVSMSDIAKETGITKSALYYYFVDKKELYQQSLRYTFQNLRQKIKKELKSLSSTQNKVSGLVETYLRFGIENRGLIYPLPTKLQELDQETFSYLKRARKHLQKSFREWLERCFTQEIKQERGNHSEGIGAIVFGLMTERIFESFSCSKKVNIKREAKKILQKVYSILQLKGRIEFKKNYIE